MKVSELIKALQKMPQDLEVLVDYGIDDLPISDPKIVERVSGSTYVLFKTA